MNQKVKIAFRILAAMLSALLCYTFLHELGHLLVMLSAGATVRSFSILSAHVVAEGGSYTTAAALWLHANGAVLPLLVSYISLLLYKPEKGGVFYRFLFLLLGVFPIGSGFAWVVLPLAYLKGNAPATDDVTKFLENFPFHPVYVSLAAAALIGIGAALLIQKKVFRSCAAAIRQAKYEAHVH